jgi:hypothetical protein
VVVFVLAALVLAFASTAGPNLAGTGGTAGTCDGFSTFCWTSPGSVTASDGVFASAFLGAGTTSNQLQATNFGFSIPAGSTINGIQVDTQNQSPNAGQLSLLIQALKAGAAAGTAKSGGVPNSYPSTEAFVTFGNNADLWNTTWTPADINSTGFGVQQQALEITGLAGATANVDSVRITITYTPPAAPAGRGHRIIQTQTRSGRVRWHLPA